MARENLSQNDLVERMKGASRTSGWDAIVSYRLDLFSAILQQGLDNSKMEKRQYIAKGVKTYEMEGHYRKLAFELDWRISITPPTKLDFTVDGQVLLKMPVTAVTMTPFYTGRRRYDDAYRKLQAGWVLTVKGPVSCLSASHQGYGLPDGKTGTVLDFNKSGESYSGKMAFNLDLRDNWSLSIDWEGTKQLDPKKRMPKPLLDALRCYVRGDLRGIWFPIPLASNEDSSGAPFIRPQYVAFQIYSLPPDEQDGSVNPSLSCVSAYIKTDATRSGGNFVTGDLKPNFYTGQDGKVKEIYPIPKGYSASITITGMALFGNMYKQPRWQALRDVKNKSGTKAFTRFGDDLVIEPRELGFQLNMTWNGKYPAEDATKYMHDTDSSFNDGLGNDKWGDTDFIYVADVENAVNKSPKPTFTFAADGSIMWDSNIKVPFDVRAMYIGLHDTYDEVWKYTVKASKAGTFELLGGCTIQVNHSLSSSDWTTSWDDINPSQTKDFMKPFLDRLTWPAWDCKAKTNLLAITNFTNPGMKDILTLKDGVRVPYDFVFVGDVTKLS